MKRRIVGLLMAVVSAGAAAGGSVDRAAADTMLACPQTVTWSFSPPLTTVDTTGTVTFSWARTCVQASTDGSAGLSSTGLTQTLTYKGSCVAASLSNSSINSSGELIGGTVAVFTSPIAQTYVLTPTDPCADAGPTPSVGVAAGVIP
jgi:hypothetical protein